MKLRRWTIGAAAAGVGILLSASAAWACLSLAGLTTNQATVQPGGTLSVNGIEFGSNPVNIHLDTISGPVLATVTPNSNSGNFTQSVTLPAGVSSGQHVLVATEDAATANGKNNGSSTGVPARAVIQVGNSSATSPAPARPASLASSSGTGVGTLVVIALAVAAAGLFLAGSMSLVASRRRRGQAETVKAS
ncbi:MAG: hypothetical protein ACRDY0_06745 [Acidimicrobiales bacterium]